MISQRQQLASQLNPNDPESYMKIAEIAAQSGDQQFAIAVADAGRKAMSEYALIQQRTRERQSADPFQQIIRSGKYTPASLSAYEKSQNVADLVLLEKEGATTNEIQNATQLALLKGERGTPEFNAEFNSQLARLTTKEPKERNIAFGTEAERKSKSMYGKPYADLTPEEAGKVDKAVEVSEQTKAKLTASPAAVQEKQVAQNKTDFAKAIEESAFNASDRISLAQSLRELAPKAFTGFAADAKLSASKVASAFGIPTKGGTESEIIDQILGQMTIGAAGQLKGALSDKDVLFLKKTIGTRGLSVNTLMFVADEIERLAVQDRYLNKQINAVTSSGKSLNAINFEEEKTKSASFVKKQMSEYKGLLGKVANNTATLEEAKRAKQIRDELGLQ
jgi:PIN domain nuclease of toxin-antitoxin system